MSTTADRLVLTTALGIAFWDVAARSFISQGLSVSAYPAGRPFDAVAASANRSDVFVFHHLPGLRAFERGTAEATPQPYVVEVHDHGSRFLDVSFTANAPADSLFVFDCEPGQPARAAVPLYSAPQRRPLPGMAIVSAELQLASTGAPAAWAVLELDLPGHANAARGIADDQGHVALVFPYPEPAGVPIGSPGGASGPPLAQQSWSVQVHVRYGGLPVDATPPDLCAILNQPLAAPVALASANLQYGRELVLRSLGATGHPPLPVVLIGPAGSPP